MEKNLIFKSQGLQLYKNLLVYIREITDGVGKGEKISISEPMDICNYIIEDYSRSSELLETAMTYYELLDIAGSHVANVTIYVLKMSIDMNLSKKDIEEFAVAALLHDVGLSKILIPNDIRTIFSTDTAQYMSSEENRLIARRKKFPVVYIPVGNLEWHGTHNPVGAILDRPCQSALLFLWRIVSGHI